jgi:transcriptional regulator with XRE-family HTH domain
LRRERERRGISLDAIAEETKVGVSLLEGLERGDITRWPAGIFRRAFVRAYAEAVGLDSRRVLHDFLQAFPDEDESHPALSLTLVDPEGAEPLRLTLAGEARTTLGAYGTRLAVAGFDAAGVVALAAVAYLLTSPGLGALTIGAVAVAWYTAGLIATGRTPGALIMQHLRWPARSPVPPPGAASEEVSQDERAVLVDLHAVARRRQQAAQPVEHEGGRAAGR